MTTLMMARMAMPSTRRCSAAESPRPVSGVLLLTGRSSSPSISAPRGVSLRHTLRF